MSDNVIKLSENVFFRKSTECDDENVNPDETYKRESINKANYKISITELRKVTSINTNPDYIIEPKTNLTNLKESPEEKRDNNRFSEGFMKKLTSGTIQDPYIPDTIKLNDEYVENKPNIEIGHKPNEEYIFIPARIEENIQQAYTNIICSKFFLNEDFSKDIYFLFIDPKVDKGQKILNMDINGIKFDDFFSLAYLYNFKDSNKFKEAIQIIKEYQANSPKKIRILVGGGDEMVMNCIEELRLTGIDLTRCVFGTIPIGFSKNISSTLQFNSGNSIGTDMSHFKTLLQSYSKAREANIDIWKIELTLHNEGGVFKFEEGKKIELLDENNNNIVRLAKPFINYFSLGFESRVGYGLHKRKRKNMCMYFWEFIKKLICTKTMPLNDYIDIFISEDREIFKSFTDSNKISDTKYTFYKDRIILKNKPTTLVGQNITHFLGKNNIWEKSKKNIGLVFQEEGKPTKIQKQNKKEEEEIFFKQLNESEQKIDDEKMEFFTYKNGCFLCLEKILGRGYAERIHHSRGPFVIRFKKIHTKSLNDKKHRIYLTIDGDHYYLLHPLELRISLDNNYSKGVVKFLASN